MLAALAECSFHLLPPFVGSMLKHLIKHDQLVWAFLLPLGLPFQEQLHIHHSLSLSNWLAFPGCPPFGGYSLISFTPIFFDHQSVISIENKGMEYIAKKE